MPSEIVTVIAAEIIFLLARSPDVIIISKSQNQRTPYEQLRVERELFRSIVIEGVLFVPSSAILGIFLAPLMLSIVLPSSGNIPTSAISALIGVVSYGFL